MANILFIESREHFDSADGGFCAALAPRLAAAGNRVDVLLVQNGVLAARAGARDPGMATLVRAGVPVLADGFSILERGIDPQALAAGVRSSDLDVVIDRLADGWTVIWH